MDIARIQETLRAKQLDGWLLYDFHGSNPIARRIAGLNDSDKLTTRRWYYLIPARGEPRMLVHDIERHSLAHLPGERLIYARHDTLKTGLESLIRNMQKVAIEYSPDCAIPYVSRVDAGTIDHLRRLGVSPVSSGDLIQEFEATWDKQALDSHRTASTRLHEVKDRTFGFIKEHLSSGTLSEYNVQQQMVGWFNELNLVSDCSPVVAVQENSGNPHYLPTASSHCTIESEQVVLIDLWAKLDQPGSVYADITWVGYTGKIPHPKASEIFDVARAARETAVELVTERVETGHPIAGWEVDQAARTVITDAGFGDRFIHRTGHNLGEEVHGNGAHLDNYETHDERLLIAGSGFTIEPGIYLEEFGVRTEINMFISQEHARVTGPRQSELTLLA